MKKLTPQIIESIEAEVLMMLAAERDCYANWVISDTLKTMPKRFLHGPAGGGYHAEAFGIMRALKVLGYCTFGPINVGCVRGNANWWFEQLEDKAMELERAAGGAKARYRQIVRIAPASRAAKDGER